MPEPRIWILPPEVAERIAAGEVVERPASAVKELVENSLDAGARRITVEAEAGGKVLFRVTDDGIGMTAEEARLALQRHATSKLRSADDLFNIHTLGFRGEALPSIAAVSEMEILTRTPDSPEGTRLLIEGGVVRSVEPAAAQVGTTITVRRLFFNVPVREKFLRGDASEAGQITDWLQRLALAHSDVSFRLVQNGKEALLSPGSQDPLNAVVAILGRGVARELLRLPAADGEVSVTGFTGRPTLTRANRALQQFYVNGRAVRSPLFYRGMDDAYRSTMPHGRHPVCVLFITVPPDAVDVNVHPAKTEVRFRDEGAVQAAILHAVRSALRLDAERSPAEASLPESSALVETAPSDRVAEPGVPAAPPGSLPFAQAAMGGPPTPTWERRNWTSNRSYEARETPSSSSESHHRFTPERPSDTTPRPFTPDFDPFADTTPAPRAIPEFREVRREEPRPEEPLRAVPVEVAAPAPAIPELRLLGQAQDLFLLAEGGGRLWIIDQHVAHERVLFDRMTAGGPATEPAERLLLPARLEVTPAQALALEEHRALLGELGFEVEAFGPATYALRSVPRSLLGRNYETVFRDLADELAERSHGGQVQLRKEEVAAAAAGRSCKSAIKAGQKMSDAELERLLTDLQSARNPYTCPHGRPVFLTYEPDDLARLFGPRTCS